MNLEIDPVAYVLLFITLMTVVLLIILIFIIRQQMYLKKMYKKIEQGMMEGGVAGVAGEIEAAPAPAPSESASESFNSEEIAAEAARQFHEEQLLREKEEERRLLEEERAKDPGEYYTADSIRDNLLALFDRYRLNSFTMSTSDGLVISSTDPNPEEEAAKYSYLYQQGKQPDVENVRLIGVPHKGGTVVGIVKADDELSEKDLEFIERDINFILRKTV